MAKVRIYMWAKEHGHKSSEIVQKLKKQGLPVTNHTSFVEETALNKLYGSTTTQTTSSQSTKPSGYQGNKPAGQQGNPRPTTGGYKGNNPRPGYQGNNPREGYQGNKPGGYQGNNPRPGYQGNNPREGYQGNRPAGQGYQGNKPAGQGYQGNRPAGQGYQGNKPGGYQGNRPAGQGYQGNKPGGYQGGKPGGYQGRGKEPEKKEEPEQTSKRPETKKTTAAKRKKTTGYDRFAMFDTKEKNFRLDQKTKTQMKKEARKEREEDTKNEVKKLVWTDDMTISKFAQGIEIPAIDIISKLFELGIAATINQGLDREVADILCTDYNVELEEDESNSEYDFENLIPDYSDHEQITRPAIVTVMGHVDHGKTTLLDTIRKTNVTDKESGGITQHIGAYQVEHKGKKITFLDTPGHEAFSAMRARGAEVTDITILVVAADDGVMPQTKEAIKHALDAKTPLIVAINKMDKPGADPSRIMGELAEFKILSEEWGGDTPFVNISALKGEGINELLDYIEMISDIHEYKAPNDVLGYGTVIEANLDKGRGSVATILVEGGRVKTGDGIIIGHTYGSIRVMQDEYGKRHKDIGASMPAEITGLKDVPRAGDKFVIAKDFKTAQEVGEKRSEIYATQERNRTNVMSLEELNNMIAEGDVKELPIILKADVQGTAEALESSLEKIEVNGVKARVVHKGVGAINESDVMLAATSGAILIGFNTRPDANSRQLISNEKVTLLLNNVIYKIIEEIEDSMKGMREKKYTEQILGYARVDEVFKITGVGKIAGCIISSGKITRQCKMRLVREGIVIYDGNIGQLKRFKDDVKEVSEGMDCGISFADFSDIKKGDEFEGYLLEEQIED